MQSENEVEMSPKGQNGTTSLHHITTEETELGLPTERPPLDEAHRARIETLLNALCDGLYEREVPVRLTFLSAIAGESLFLLGPPGIGKSLVARRIKYAFKEGNSFEYLMSRFSTPDEIFGPVSIKRLKDEDKYERITESYLPGAHIVFLDEIWKAGPAIQNALLTVLNEKIYRNGDQEVEVNIKGIVSASNELPPKGEGLGALWDRFLMRYPMGGIRNQDSFLEMITDTENVYEDTLTPEIKLGDEEYYEWSEKVDAIEVPPEVLNTIQVVRAKLDEHNLRVGRESSIRIYDRRWKKIIRMLRASAFLNGRQYVDLMDCFLIAHCLWDNLEHLEIVQDIIAETIRNHGYSLAIQLTMLKREMDEFEEEVERETTTKHIVVEERLKVHHEQFYRLMPQGRPFDSPFIKLEEFRKLRQDDWAVISIFSEEQKLGSRLKAKQSPQEHSLDFEYNSQQYTVRLDTENIERAELIERKPHPLLVKHWDEKVRRLRVYIEGQLKLIQEDAPGPLAHLDRNLFVDATFATIVRSNIDEVSQALAQLKIRLEKVHHAYTTIG